MTSLATAQACRWLVCESGERWYRGVCQHGPAMVRCGAILRVERVAFEKPTQIVSRVNAASEPIVVLWELPELRIQPVDFLARLELISVIRMESPGALQVASFSLTTPIEAVLLAQEAGISFVLHGLWSLPSIKKAVSSYFSPLG